MWKGCFEGCQKVNCLQETHMCAVVGGCYTTIGFDLLYSITYAKYCLANRILNRETYLSARWNKGYSPEPRWVSSLNGIPYCTDPYSL